MARNEFECCFLLFLRKLRALRHIPFSICVYSRYNDKKYDAFNKRFDTFSFIVYIIYAGPNPPLVVDVGSAFFLGADNSIRVPGIRFKHKNRSKDLKCLMETISIL